MFGSESGPVSVSEASGIQAKVSCSLVFILISISVHNTVTGVGVVSNLIVLSVQTALFWSTNTVSDL